MHCRWIPVLSEKAKARIASSYIWQLTPNLEMCKVSDICLQKSWPQSSSFHSPKVMDGWGTALRWYWSTWRKSQHQVTSWNWQSSLPKAGVTHCQSNCSCDNTGLSWSQECDCMASIDACRNPHGVLLDFSSNSENSDSKNNHSHFENQIVQKFKSEMTNNFIYSFHWDVRM